jgi:predicted NBD/HSP70 family sugar kinase
MTTARTTGRGTQLLRATHRHQVTELLRVHGPLARTELADLLGVTRSAITAIVAGLIDDGLVREQATAEPTPSTSTSTSMVTSTSTAPPATAKRAERGRPRVLVECDPDAARVVGVQIGAKRARVVLADAAGAVIGEASAGVAPVGPQVVVDRVVRLARDLVGDQAVAAAGICVPGSVDSTTGTVLHSDVLGPAWEGVEVAGLVGGALDIPAFAQDVTQATTLAEALYGAAAGASHALVLDYGGRFGVGLIVDGRLHRGSSGLAGSVGHTPVYGESTPCRCGRNGCLEAVATSHAMVTAANAGPASAGPASATGATTSAGFAEVVERVSSGDETAVQAVTQALEHTAHVATFLVGLVDPEVVVLAGMVGAYPEFAARLGRRIVELTPPHQAGRFEVRTTTLGPEAWMKGAVLVALQQLQPDMGTILAGAGPAPLGRTGVGR